MIFQKKKEKSAELRPDSSAQGLIPYTEYYDNGIFRLSEDVYTIVCEFSDAGYLSKTEVEKERKYRAYLRALESLPTYIHYQEVIYNRPVDEDKYLEAVAPVSEYNSDYEEAFFTVQRKFVKGIGRDIALKRRLLALSVKAVKNESPGNKLFDALKSLQAAYREMGATLELLSPAAAFAELYRFYNPYGGDMLPIPPDLYRRGLSVRDMIAPDSLRIFPNYLLLGSAYVRIFCVSSFGSELQDNLIYSILNNNLTVFVTKHLEHVGKEQAIKSINNRLSSLEGTRQTRLKDNKHQGYDYIPADLSNAIVGCNNLLQKLSETDELFNVTMYVTVCEKSLEALDDVSERIKANALAYHCTLRPVSLFMDQALKSELPLGANYLKQHQFMLSSEVAVAVPFSYESFFDPNGFFYGYNEHSGEPLIINRKLDKSSGGFVFGVTGSGKGIFVKHELTNVLWQPAFRDDDIIIIDATGEYLPLATAAGGTVIDLKASGNTTINPLHLSPAQVKIKGKEPARAARISDLIALLSQIKDSGGLTAAEKALVDEAARNCFRGKDPSLNSFYEILKGDTRETAQNMCEWLDRYVNGSITLFSGSETADAPARLKVYCLKELSGDLKNAAMVAMLTRIEEQVMTNFLAGKWTWIYVDEFHRYFDEERNPYAAARFAQLYSEIRHWGGILTGITQLPNPVIQSKEGAVMLANSRFVVMAELDVRNANAVAELYDLNEDQKRTLGAPSVGQYVLRSRNAPIGIRLLYPGAKPEDKNKMFDLFNTSFEGKEQEAMVLPVSITPRLKAGACESPD